MVGRPVGYLLRVEYHDCCTVSREEETRIVPDEHVTQGLVPYTGVDAAEISRITHAVERWGQRFLDRVYTPDEQRYCGTKMQRLAGRFAAKEAISKVLGTGIRYVHWRDLEILPDRAGKPTVRLYNRAAARAQALQLGPIGVSITHTGDLALAFAMALGKE
jgi:holo-[acyl-carrier protein] synthase